MRKTTSFLYGYFGLLFDTFRNCLGGESMVFVKAASVKDLQATSMIGVEVGGKEVVVVNVEGKYYTIGNRCTHMGCMLADGTLKGANVTCPCHGSTFDVKTGNVVKGPAKKPEPAYQTKIEGEEILVDV